MLRISRQVGESVVCGDCLITVHRISNDVVRLDFNPIKPTRVCVEEAWIRGTDLFWSKMHQVYCAFTGRRLAYVPYFILNWWATGRLWRRWA